MNTTLAFVLTALGFLAVAQPRALATDPTAGASPDSPPAPLAVDFRRWHQGEPPLQLIRREEGFCALTSVTGDFEGVGEQVRVYVGDDGYWYLGGKSHQHGVAAECMVVRFPGAVPAPAPAPAPDVNVLAASYSFGSHFADVTARVKELLHDGNVFQANPGSLLVDPQPFWNKALVIFCEIRGKRAIFSADEGADVSRALLLEKARLVSDPPAVPPGTRTTDAPVSPPTGKADSVTVRGLGLKVPVSIAFKPGLTATEAVNATDAAQHDFNALGSVRYLRVLRNDVVRFIAFRTSRYSPYHDIRLQPGDIVEIPEGSIF